MQCGIVCAVIYGVLGILGGVFFLFMASVANSSHLNNGMMTSALAGAMGIGMAIFMPFLYALAGFISGILLALLYNVTARWTGGIRYSVTLES